MASSQPVTCQIQYTLDLAQLGAFETYARTWMPLIELYGGIHHGYFIPRTNPDEVGPSFPGLGYDGPTDVAIAMFTFPDEESYRLYRKEGCNRSGVHHRRRSRASVCLFHTLRTSFPPARNEGMKYRRTGKQSLRINALVES